MNGAILCPDCVSRIFAQCNLSDNTSDPIIVEGIHGKLWFDPRKVDMHDVVIAEMVSRLPQEFSRKQGATFESAYRDRVGMQWTTSEQAVERLLALGVAAGVLEIVPGLDEPVRPGAKLRRVSRG